MKTQRRIFLISGIAAAILAMAFTASAQKLGGYKDIPKTDAAAKEAAEFAVSTQAEKTSKTMELVTVVHAERQVVQGTNYRLCLQVNSEGGEGQDDVTIFVKVVVYVDLKGNHKLTSWEISDCGDE